PQGTYSVSAAAGGCLVPATVDLTLDTATTLDLVLERVTDEYGYQCRVVGFDYIPAETPVGIGGDDNVATLDLPFSFTFYGQTYEQIRVDTNGYVAFAGQFSNYDNTSIPNVYEPNAAIFGLWD